MVSALFFPLPGRLRTVIVMHRSSGSHVTVMAKAPLPGRVKTRLCPPCTPEEAAGIAEAALADTLSAVAASGADRHVIALDGAPGDWLPHGFEIVAQHGHTFAARLASAWTVVGGLGIQIGMDTPQVTGPMLDSALDCLLAPRIDAVLGPAVDGGWWAIGFRRACRGAFDGVPMSTPTTGAMQRSQLARLGLQVADLPMLRDLDTIDDAVELAALLPNSRTATALAAVVMSAVP
jgi:uncharacterized protein